MKSFHENETKEELKDAKRLLISYLSRKERINKKDLERQITDKVQRIIAKLNPTKQSHIKEEKLNGIDMKHTAQSELPKEGSGRKNTDMGRMLLD